MFSAEDQQTEICLLKLNLEEIENDLVAQCSAIPALEAESKQKYNETMTVLREVRSLNSDIEKLKQQNIRLTAKRVQLKRQSDELANDLKTAHTKREELANLLKQEETETCQYEDVLQEKADRFRRTLGYYDEAQVNKELDNVNNTIAEIETEFGKKQNVVDGMKIQAEGLSPEVPENLLTICEKEELYEKVKALTAEFDALSAKRKMILL